MATTKEQLLKKRYNAENRKVRRMMDKYREKYGRNWTKDTLTARENAAFLSALRRQKKAINALVDLEIKAGRIKRLR